MCDGVQVCGVLAALEEFFAATEPEVEAITGEESHTHAFMRLMGIFNKVRPMSHDLLSSHTPATPPGQQPAERDGY